MDSQLAELLGIKIDDPLDQLADKLVKSDDDLLDQLVEIRRASGLKQDDVAKRMGISQGAVARIEGGERDPHLSTLRRYAHAVRAEVTHVVVPFKSVSVPDLPQWKEQQPAPSHGRSKRDVVWSI